MAISCVIMSAPMSAQRKQIGEARTILKSGKNLEQAEKLMEKMTMANPAVHVASFNAAYRCVAVMEWLFSQAKVFHDVVK